MTHPGTAAQAWPAPGGETDFCMPNRLLAVLLNTYTLRQTISTLTLAKMAAQRVKKPARANQGRLHS